MTLLTLSDVDDLSGVHNTMVHQKSIGKIVCTILQGLKICNQPGVCSIRVLQCLSQGSLTRLAMYHKSALLSTLLSHDLNHYTRGTYLR